DLVEEPARRACGRPRSLFPRLHRFRLHSKKLCERTLTYSELEPRSPHGARRIAPRLKIELDVFDRHRLASFNGLKEIAQTVNHFGAKGRFLHDRPTSAAVAVSVSSHIARPFRSTASHSRTRLISALMSARSAGDKFA